MNIAAVIDVELLTTTLLGVTPLPLTLTVAPLMKPVPVNVSTTVVPISPLVTLSEVNVGNDTGVTVEVEVGDTTGDTEDDGVGDTFGGTTVCGLFVEHPLYTNAIAMATTIRTRC
jgi:hypothetical protein